MKKVEVTVYKFLELPEKVREKVKEKFSSHSGYFWSEEAIESLEALAKHFDGKLKDYSIDFFAGSYSNAIFEVPDEPLSKKEIAKRLKALGTYDKKTLKGHGDCKLTGVCHDEDAIDGFRRAFFQGEENLERLLQAGFRTWLKASQNDAEHEYSDEGFSETAEANEWEYFEDGRLATGYKNKGVQ
jgi:hypothetical protein